jgi:hypothetical protein
LHLRTHAIVPAMSPRGALSLRVLLAPSGGPEDGERSDGAPDSLANTGDDLPYKVEVWDEGSRSVEQTLAITANGSIGYAAYYEATKEFPTRYITLRHKNRVVARWNPPGH